MGVLPAKEKLCVPDLFLQPPARAVVRNRAMCVKLEGPTEERQELHTLASP